MEPEIHLNYGTKLLLAAEKKRLGHENRIQMKIFLTKKRENLGRVQLLTTIYATLPLRLSIRG